MTVHSGTIVARNTVSAFRTLQENDRIPLVTGRRRLKPYRTSRLSNHVSLQAVRVVVPLRRSCQKLYA